MWGKGKGPSSKPDVSWVHSALTSVQKKQISNRDKSFNSDPLVQLIGEANEAPGHVDVNECTTLIDSAAQISTITLSLDEDVLMLF